MGIGTPCTIPVMTTGWCGGQFGTRRKPRSDFSRPSSVLGPRDVVDGRASRVELTDVNGVPAVLVVDGPEGWSVLQQPPYGGVGDLPTNRGWCGSRKYDGDSVCHGPDYSAQCISEFYDEIEFALRRVADNLFDAFERKPKDFFLDH